MTLSRPLIPKLLLPLLAFVTTFALISLLNGSSAPDRGPSAEESGFRSGGRSSDDRIALFQSALRTDAKSVSAQTGLGEALLQKARETGDPSLYERAVAAFGSALNQRPDDAAALAGLGGVALARHDFRAALAYGRHAHAAAPGVTRIYAVIVDALVELGRYQEAERVLQRMVDLKPNLSSYARVSYLRELHGDFDGAAEAMRLAVSAGGDTPENIAYVQTLLGNLELERGRIAAAERAYRSATRGVRGYVPAQVGRARVDAVRGDLGDAIRRYRGVVRRLPLPEYVIALAEVELAAGHGEAARRDLELVAVEARLLRANGVNSDVELALFEANHGDAGRAVSLARRSWGAAPSVRSADALGWALTRAGRPREGLDWARRALKLGSRDPLLLYHAGISARAAGRPGLARRHLTAALARNPRFSPLYAPRAKRALSALPSASNASGRRS